MTPWEDHRAWPISKEADRCRALITIETTFAISTPEKPQGNQMLSTGTRGVFGGTEMINSDAPLNQSPEAAKGCLSGGAAVQWSGRSPASDDNGQTGVSSEIGKWSEW
jgi:hypothetical protein